MRLLRKTVETPESFESQPENADDLPGAPLPGLPGPGAHGPSLAGPPPPRQISQEQTPSQQRGQHVAFLDQWAKIKGALQFDCPIRIDGQIEGEIIGKQDIVIGENARVIATIRAASVVIEGQVNGDVIATERIQLSPKAKVLGNLTAPALVIQEGAQYEGRCSMKEQPKDSSGHSGTEA